jgi:tetratricopeptide (TPR) repeat protein
MSSHLSIHVPAAIRCVLLVLLVAGPVATQGFSQNVDPLQPAIQGQPVEDLRLAVQLPSAQAIERLRSLVDKVPNYYNAQYQLGLALAKAGSYREALGPFAEARSIGARENINNAALLNTTGWTYYLLGSYTLSRDNLEEAKKTVSPADRGLSEKILNNLGTLYLAMGDLKSSRQYFSQSSQLFGSAFAKDNIKSIGRIEALIQTRQ